ncbi:MAG: hypothetical protein WCO77_01295 [bacterium]
MGARYDRALNPDVESLLSKGGLFNFLITDTPGLSPDDAYALDIQVREGNVLMYYHGTTRLLTLHFRWKSLKSQMTIKAHASSAYGEYAECCQQYQALMKEWSISDISNFKDAWQAYLKSAMVAANDRYYGNHREGFWQNRLCVEFGRNWTPSSDWLVIDRECVIGFKRSADKKAHYEKANSKAQEIKLALQNSDKVKWGTPDNKGFGDEVDMLAIDKSGSLVVIELKHGVNAKGIYWGPLQAGVYQTAFKAAPLEVLKGVEKLIAQKIKLGLLPNAAAKRVPSFLKLGDPVLAIAEPKKDSRCWGKLGEVCQKTKDWPLKIVMIEMQNDHCAIFQCEPDRQALQSCMNGMRGK